MKKGIIAAALTICVLLFTVSSALYVGESKTVRKYRQTLQNEYSSALNEMSERFENISVLLEKCIYSSNDSKLMTYAAHLSGEAQIAKINLSKLPVVASNYENINRFLSQVGNFALALGGKFFEGSTVSDSQSKQLSELHQVSQKLSRAISDLNIKYNNPDHWNKIFKSDIENDDILSKNLAEIEDKIAVFPSLFYNGEYSDYSQNKQPEMLLNSTAVSDAEAGDIVQSFLPSGSEALDYKGDLTGKISAYSFESSEYYAAVSKMGGHLLFLYKKGEATGKEIAYEYAVETAEAFLQKNGYKNMHPIGYFSADGVCTVSFAYLDGQTLCYTDSVKVGVSLFGGDIAFLEAEDYIMNHRMRAFESVKYSESDAAQELHSSLKIISSRLVLMNIDGGETRCYEFYCEGEGGRKLLVYVNTKKLTTEEILLIDENEGGKTFK